MLESAAAQQQAAVIAIESSRIISYLTGVCRKLREASCASSDNIWTFYLLACIVRIARYSTAGAECEL
jgi:hypothetical protein